MHRENSGPFFDAVHPGFGLPLPTYNPFQGTLKDRLDVWHISSLLLPRGDTGSLRCVTWLCTKSVVLCSLQDIPRRRLKNFVWNVWIILVVSSIRVQISHPKGSMDLSMFILVGKLLFLHFQILVSFAIVDSAIDSLVLISVVERPSLVRIKPRYLKAILTENSNPETTLARLERSNQ